LHPACSLQGNFLSVFLFKKAYEQYFKEPEGSLYCIANPRALEQREVSETTCCTLIAAPPPQMACAGF